MSRAVKDLEEYKQRFLEPAINNGWWQNFGDKWISLPSHKDIKEYDPNLTVTIVSANWGNTPVIPAHIESIAKQDYPHDKIEIIFVDDNSPDQDECIKTMKQLMVKHNDLSIRLFETHKNVNWNSTVPSNIGVKRAKGDIIIFCDSDVLIVGKDYITATVKHHSQHRNLWLNSLNYEFSSRDLVLENITKEFSDIGQANFEDPTASKLYIIAQPIMWRGGSVRRDECIKLHCLDESFKGWGGYEGQFYKRLKKDGFISGQDYTMQTIHMWDSLFKPQIKEHLFPQGFGQDNTPGDLVVNPNGWGEIDALEEIHL